MNSPKIDPELEQVTADHLDTLSALVSNDQITNSELRTASVTLRSLICNDELSKVAQARSYSVRVTVPDTAELIQSIGADLDTLFLQLGGYNAFGVEVSATIVERRASTRPQPFDPSKQVDVKLSAFKS